MVPILDKIGRAAFMFYMFFVLISFIVAVAYQVGGAEPPGIAKQYGNLPEIKAVATLGNQTYDAVVQYVQTTQTVTFLSLQAVMQALSYILNAVLNMGGFFASLAHALLSDTPLHGPAVAVAATVGYTIQALAWMWIITSITSLLRGG